MVMVGEITPDFKLESTDAGEIELSRYIGSWVVMFFFPAAFTGVCQSEVVEYNKELAKFKKLNTSIIGVSTDNVPTLQAWSKELGGIAYPLLSDFKKAVSRLYGVLVEDKGMALRGTFIIDPDGILRYMLHHDFGIGRSTDETLRVLQALQTGEACPINWKPSKNKK